VTAYPMHGLGEWSHVGQNCIARTCYWEKKGHVKVDTYTVIT